MYKYCLVFFFFITSFQLYSQDVNGLKGILKNNLTKEPLSNINVKLATLSLETYSSSSGYFEITDIPVGNYTIEITATGFEALRIPVIIQEKEILDLGVLFLSKDVINEELSGLISLVENDVEDNSSISFSPGFLQADRDVFQTKAAFEWSQAFFRIRGLDTRERSISFNGVRFNKLFNGRPQFNNWGGLNDATRNQTYTYGLEASTIGFGGVLGGTDINTRASLYRAGLRISSSGSDRTYSGRLMATYHSGLLENGFAYSISASRRWAEEGFIEGTLYDAYSVFASLEYRLTKNQSLNITAFLASNRRGQSTAITEEVFELAGRTYNPFWGIQNGSIRNSRVRTIREPVFMINHFFERPKFHLNTSVSYQTGIFGRTRLSFFNAPNPDPSNFRNLPSFFINTNGNASFENAALAREGFLENSQIDWNAIFLANTNNSNRPSAYIIQEDRTDDTFLVLNTIGNFQLNTSLNIDLGANISTLNSDNYALIDDLLGGNFIEDIDPFSETQNDLNTGIIKAESDRFAYSYILEANQASFFTQIRLTKPKWNAFLTAELSQTNYQRTGQFQNERFLENSLGESDLISFSNISYKGGFSYKINGRHLFSFEASSVARAPDLQHIFVNPRSNNIIVPNIRSEQLQSASLNYYARLPKINARISSFYTRFKDRTDIGFFFVEGGFGSDFVQEVTTGIDQLHLGVEFGLNYSISSTTQITAAASYGNYIYDSNPDITIFFDPLDDESINTDGFLDLGQASLKGLKLSTGPQQAYSLGITYRDPKYWWLSVTANHLADSFIGISKINRTSSFTIDPDTGMSAQGATPEAVNELLNQEPLEAIYLLNITAGKSWLIGDKYISLFSSINNALDLTYQTGGFEQSRRGNFKALQRDRLRGNPSFGPRHWYGFGRTFFINLSVSF